MLHTKISMLAAERMLFFFFSLFLLIILGVVWFLSMYRERILVSSKTVYIPCFFFVCTCTLLYEYIFGLFAFHVIILEEGLARLNDLF